MIKTFSGDVLYGCKLARSYTNTEALMRSAGKLAAIEDRKSTRLNSSHTVISYAVFCLKKKKKLREHLPSRPRLEPSAGRPHHPPGRPPATQRTGGTSPTVSERCPCPKQCSSSSCPLCR